MGGGFRKEGGAVGPILDGLAGDLFVGGIFIYMELHSPEGGGQVQRRLQT